MISLKINYLSSADSRVPGLGPKESALADSSESFGAKAGQKGRSRSRESWLIKKS